jgi:hypothetical protein
VDPPLAAEYGPLGWDIGKEILCAGWESVFALRRSSSAHVM